MDIIDTPYWFVWDKTDNHWGIVLAKNINSGIVFGEQIANNGWVEINNNHGWWYNNFSYTYKKYPSLESLIADNFDKLLKR